MPDIHIHREHHLGFAEARKVGVSWAEKAEKKFDMDCSYEEGDTQDTLYFSRAGVKGTLLVDAHQFEMKAALGFLFWAPMVFSCPYCPLGLRVFSLLACSAAHRAARQSRIRCGP